MLASIARSDALSKVFLSYAHRGEDDAGATDDTETLVLKIYDWLKAHDFDPWIDQTTLPGHAWRREITQAIQGRVHFFSFLSRRAVRANSPCQRELFIAQAAFRSIQTFLVDDGLDDHLRKRMHEEYQWHDFRGWKAVLEQENSIAWQSWFEPRMQQVLAVLKSPACEQQIKEGIYIQSQLRPREFTGTMLAKIQGFVGRRWLFEEVDSWLQGHSTRMFWLQGHPGVGKSTFAAWLALEHPEQVVGFYALEHRSAERLTVERQAEQAREVIFTLAADLAKRFADYRGRLYFLLQDQAALDKLSVDDLFVRLISNPMNSLETFPRDHKCLLVIDGLDESGAIQQAPESEDGGHYRNVFAEMLASRANELAACGWLKILVTSRPEKFLKQRLSVCNQVSIEVNSTHHGRDIEEYIDSILPRTLHNRFEVATAYRQKASGSFLYLRMQADWIREEPDSEEPFDIEQLPSNLDAQFLRIFDRLLSSGAFKGVAYRDSTIKAFLELLVAAPGPLPKLMALEILQEKYPAFSEGLFQVEVLTPLSGFLIQTEDGISFFHTLLAEWLRNAEQSDRYAVGHAGYTVLAGFMWNCMAAHFKSDSEVSTMAWFEQISDWYPAFDIYRSFKVEDILFEVCVRFFHRLVDFWSLKASLKRSLSWAELSLMQATALSKKDSSNKSWQRSLAESYKMVGEILYTQGDFAFARQYYEKFIAIMEALVEGDSANCNWQKSLSESYSRMGHALFVNETAGALSFYEKARAIMEALVEMDPTNASWQQQLAESYSFVGCVVGYQENTAGALSYFKKSLFITQALVEKEQANTFFQRELAKKYRNVGEVLSDRFDLEGALSYFEKSVAIMQALVKKNPDNADWQTELYKNYIRMGDVLGAQANPSGALPYYGKSLASLQALVEKDPANAMWKTDLSTAQHRESNALVALSRNDPPQSQVIRYEYFFLSGDPPCKVGGVVLGFSDSRWL